MAEKIVKDSQGLVNDLANDCISRQAAIDALMAILDRPNHAEFLYTDEICKALWQLPSAQPEITDEQAILHLQTSGWMQTHDKEMFEMGLREKLADDSDSYDALLPSAQPERKGKWIEMGTNKDGTHSIRCSKCGGCYKTRGHARSIATKAKYKFCPNCGANMRGEKDG